MKKQNEKPWKIIIALVILLSVLSFTPLVIPSGKNAPFLLGLPYTLWMGMLVAFIIVFLTFLGTRFHPGDDEF